MSSLEKLIPDLDALLPELEEVYKDLHRHPELSMYEYRTAEIAANYLVRYGDAARRHGRVAHGRSNRPALCQRRGHP
jgi:metal-dependent amidase/aminoacylase/carboxypeptidase family protein